MQVPHKFGAVRIAAVLVAAAVLLTAIASPVIAGELNARDLALVDRLSWGLSPSSVAQVRAVGIDRWIESQLHPLSATLPEAVRARLDEIADGYATPLAAAVAFDEQQKAFKDIVDPDQKKTAQQAYQKAMTDRAQQAAARGILRALYAPDQLRERLTWFWFNHFNVSQRKANLRIWVGDYQDTAIRPHALGRFRDLLGATLRHPAMLRYLDNAENAANRVNENYAREIMELHTMGVGSGYTQSDVEALAKILTGVGINLNPDNPKVRPEWQALLLREGAFVFNPARHDFSDKVFLGHTIKGRGFAEIDEALDLLCAQPATARFVSRKLATYFAADQPSDALVQAMAQTFAKSGGDIAAVMATMIRSPDFVATLDQKAKFKDPMQYVLSAIRLAYDERVILNTLPVQNWLNRLAEGLFNHETPDGYALTSSAWTGPGQMMVRFEIARQIGGGSAGLFRAPDLAATDQPAFPLLQNALYFNALRQTLSPTTMTALDQAVSPQDWNTLFLSSPEFMH